MKLRRLRVLTATALLLASSNGLAARAATPDVVDGELVGASDVLVDGTLYDVKFQDGTCVDLFDGCDEVSDFPGEDWGWRPERSVFVSPDAWVDTIGRDSASLFTVPPVQMPQTPLGTTAVDHRDGAWKHGSTETFPGPNNNAGKTVRTLRWQIYQDHARHE